MGESQGEAAALSRATLRVGNLITEGGIESGSVFVNDSVRPDPGLPPRGVKESGCGRKLPSYGVKEFVNIKTVVMA
jgi:succinate-semialdehyde dehydrogenase/glutarate-semialdehyde dehydrogenase